MKKRMCFICCVIYVLILASLICGEEEVDGGKTKGETPSADTKSKKDGPEMRLYRERNVKSKGSTKIPDELNSDPFQTGQAINYYFGHSPNCAREPLERASDLFSTEWYFPNVETILILHDKCGSGSDVWMSGILEALRMRDIWHNYNVFVMEFPGFMCEIKDKLADLVGMKSDLEEATKDISEFIKNGLTNGNIRLDQINLIGLGMGAQLAGDVGRAVQDGDDRVKSIVGLNPSKFENVPPVSKDDAQIVQLLHTDSREVGTAERIGTADFVFNGANSTQPLCEGKGPDCSHNRCFQIFTAVIVFTSRFQAWRCSSWEDFVADGSKCADDYGYIFYPPDETLEGTYYLRVGRTFPYGIGEDGMKFDKKTVDNQYIPGYKPKINRRISKPNPSTHVENANPQSQVHGSNQQPHSDGQQQLTTNPDRILNNGYEPSHSSDKESYTPEEQPFNPTEQLPHTAQASKPAHIVQSAYSINGKGGYENNPGEIDQEAIDDNKPLIPPSTLDDNYSESSAQSSNEDSSKSSAESDGDEKGDANVLENTNNLSTGNHENLITTEIHHYHNHHQVHSHHKHSPHHTYHENNHPMPLFITKPDIPTFFNQPSPHMDFGNQFPHFPDLPMMPQYPMINDNDFNIFSNQLSPHKMKIDHPNKNFPFHSQMQFPFPLNKKPSFPTNNKFMFPDNNRFPFSSNMHPPFE